MKYLILLSCFVFFGCTSEENVACKLAMRDSISMTEVYKCENDEIIWYTTRDNGGIQFTVKGIQYNMEKEIEEQIKEKMNENK